MTTFFKAQDGAAIEKTKDKQNALVLWFDECGIEDVPLVGGKNASLGEMIQQLMPKGVNVPLGFATTAHAYREFVKKGGIEKELRALFEGLDVTDTMQLASVGRKARNLIIQTPFPQELEEAIVTAYVALCKRYGDESGSIVDTAVRSSATAEDLPDASFAGQQETYLNVHGTDGVLDACHRCFASLFTNRAISYRTLKNFDHFEVALSVGVQKMVRSDMASAGVAFSIDTETGFKDAVVLTAAYGLGENVVQGSVNPDEYIVHKPTLAKGYKPVLNKTLGTKNMRMIYDTSGTKLVKNIPVSLAEQRTFCLTEEEILTLSQWVMIIEDHYSAKRGKWTPMDVEWAKDGHSKELFIVQARPETVQSNKDSNILSTYALETTPSEASILARGKAVGEMIGQGKASVIKNVHDIDNFQAGHVLVTQRTDPDWEPVMKKSKAIVTDQGGRTCHAAIIARELGIPAIVGTSTGSVDIPEGAEITINCAGGEDGRVYEGLIPFTKTETSVDSIPSTETSILMNVGNPSEAFALSRTPCEGVGLARLEFVIANHIRVHPLALIHFDQLEDKSEKREIAELTQGYEGRREEYFVEKLASGMATIAASFYPRPVIVRCSDFKSNEYSNLLGGKQFEPKEENPMIGWRGASRYYDPKYKEGFALECRAFKKAREEMGLTNIIPMIPFCRTPAEGKRVVEEMKKNGLEQGVNDLQIYVMCEIPANVLLADEFSEIFDGFSIGSNDLTQLTLGLDRDSALVSHLFDERNGAVKKLISMVVAAAKKNKKKVGICGQAPSDFPDFVEFLVSIGIDSISLNSDTVLKTRLTVAELEKKRKSE